jgi:thymidylate kinase
VAAAVESIIAAEVATPPGERRPRVIYLCGNDGTGKTTQARLVVGDLERRGVRVRYVWLRFPQLVSLPILALSRALGITRYRTVGGQRVGRWEFHRAKWLAKALLWTQVVDAALFRLARVDLAVHSGTTVVLDRFALDIVVDIAAAADDHTLLDTVPARILRRLAGNARIALLDADSARLRDRRVDLVDDPLLERRAVLYRQLALLAGLPTIDADRPKDEVHAALFRVWK